MTPAAALRRALAVALALSALAGCPRGRDERGADPAAAGAARLTTPPPPPASDAAPAEVTLPPAPPLPTPPPGLPPPPAHAGVTPEAVALGELLFHDPRLSSTGAVACAACHVPAAGFAGEGRAPTAAGKPNLRRAPALVDLAWAPALGWDGRYPSVAEHLAAHVRGQLGQDLAAALPRLTANPTYRAHLARAGGPTPATMAAALAAYVLTRYSAPAPWDRLERAPDVPAELAAGYALFTGKAQCATCHPPPLYTDHGFHRLGLITPPDEGRGRVDPRAAGAFRTPGLRGAAARRGFFHGGQASTLAEAIDWHLAGGISQGADASIVDLRPVALAPAERAALGAFVAALSPAAPAAPPAPALP